MALTAATKIHDHEINPRLLLFFKKKSKPALNTSFLNWVLILQSELLKCKKKRVNKLFFFTESFNVCLKPQTSSGILILHLWVSEDLGPFKLSFKIFLLPFDTF